VEGRATGRHRPGEPTPGTPRRKAHVKFLLLVFLGVVALNLVVILAIVAVLVIDYIKSRRKEPENDAHLEAS
jgi:hypothetical protein